MSAASMSPHRFASIEPDEPSEEAFEEIVVMWGHILLDDYARRHPELGLEPGASIPRDCFFPRNE